MRFKHSQQIVQEHFSERKRCVSYTLSNAFYNNVLMKDIMINYICFARISLLQSATGIERCLHENLLQLTEEIEISANN